MRVKFLNLNRSKKVNGCDIFETTVEGSGSNIPVDVSMVFDKVGSGDMVDGSGEGSGEESGTSIVDLFAQIEPLFNSENGKKNSDFDLSS